MKILDRILKIKKKNIVSVTETREQQLIEIGSLLREARLSKQITLDQIAQKTRIPKRLLSAIEEANLNTLPEPIYIRELIKQFANVLDLDGAELSGGFPVESERKPISGRKSWLRLVVNLPGVTALNLRASHLYFLYILLVMFAVQQISDLAQPSTIQATEEEEIEPVLPKPLTPSPSVVASNPPVNGDKKPDKPVVVNITVKDKTWVVVTVDGKKDFEGTLTKGTHRTWVADQQLTILTGNAGGVMVAFKDEKAKQLGKPGQVQKVTFQANAGS